MLLMGADGRENDMLGAREYLRAALSLESATPPCDETPIASSSY